jgi:hypothetical protein
MKSKFLHLAKIAGTMSLPLLITRSLKKFGLDSSWTRRIDFLSSEEMKRPNKAIEIILGSLLKADLSAKPIAEKIVGGQILEIGCGRHCGLAPFALGLGARQYIGVDPSFDEELLKLSDVRERYLLPALDAARLFASAHDCFNHLPFVMSGSGGVEEMLSQSRFEKSGIEQLIGEDIRADICVSISCLEHIIDFSRAIKAIADLCHERTEHVHIVNFSNHLSKQQPFHQLYEEPYAEFGRRWNYNINGMRISDMQRELTNVGIHLRAIPLTSCPGALPKKIDSTWLARYGSEELSIRSALLTSL